MRSSERMARSFERSRTGAEAPRWASLPLRRLFWISLFVVHMGPIVSFAIGLVRRTEAPNSAESLARILGLAFWSAFFVLKIVDVPWLRLKPGWRSRLAAVLVVVLLHLGVIDRAIAGEATLSPTQWTFVLTAAATWQGDEARRRIGRWLAQNRRRGVIARRLTGNASHFPAAWLKRFHGPMQQFVAAFTRLRAPPTPA